MGNDGGSIPDRRDLVKNKPKAEQADKANQIRAKWFFCALSKRPLQEPIVSCGLGKLYNKDSIIEFLLDRSAYGDGAEICGHIRSLKDVTTLKFTPKPTSNASDAVDDAKFVCPLTYKDMNGSQPFVYLLPCGCVFSQAGLRTISGFSHKSEKEADAEDVGKDDLDICPQCATKFSKLTDIMNINPSSEEESFMRLAMEQRRAQEPVKTKTKKRKAETDTGQFTLGDAPLSTASKKKKPSPYLPSPSIAPGLNPSISAASRTLASKLAEEEIKRKANMSDAVKSLYRNKNEPERKETFMTFGTFTRYA